MMMINHKGDWKLGARDRLVVNGIWKGRIKLEWPSELEAIGNTWQLDFNYTIKFYTC
jgi:hypothetical protein